MGLHEEDDHSLSVVGCRFGVVKTGLRTRRNGTESSFAPFRICRYRLVRPIYAIRSKSGRCHTVSKPKPPIINEIIQSPEPCNKRAATLLHVAPTGRSDTVWQNPTATRRELSELFQVLLRVAHAELQRESEVSARLKRFRIAVRFHSRHGCGGPGHVLPNVTNLAECRHREFGDQLRNCDGPSTQEGFHDLIVEKVGFGGQRIVFLSCLIFPFMPE
jgi:hypothetical protein